MRKIYYEFLGYLSKGVKLLYCKRLRVLAFHEIRDPEKFEVLVKYIVSEYNVISIETLENHLYSNTPLPKLPILITFDDGDESVLKYGLPALKKYNCPAIVFIIASLINSKNNFWWESAFEHYLQEGKQVLEAKRAVRNLKRISNRDRVSKITRYPVIPKDQLTIEDLYLFEENNIVIGNHSFTHPIFSKCEPYELNMELQQTKEFFKKNRLNGFKFFAYPNGDFNQVSENVLRDYGVSLAFLFDHKINEININAMRISRIRVNSDMDLSELKAKVSGLHPQLFRLKKKLKI